MEGILSLFQSFFTNLEYLVPTMWVTLGCASAWFILSAKSEREITMEEAELLWKTHKQFTNCQSEKFTALNKRNKIVGYRCQCGHEQKQERPLINIRH
jgi:hypothetical protein